MAEERIYYVYQWRRNDTGALFYVGKGKQDRKNWGTRAVRSGARFKNAHLGNVCRKLVREGTGWRVEVVGEELSEREALDFEIETVASIGRVVDGTGPLLNITPGGDGVVLPAFVYEEIVARRRVGKGYSHTPETIAKIKATIAADPSAQERMRENGRKTKGRRHTDEVKAKIAAASKEFMAGRLFPEDARMKSLTPEALAKRVATRRQRDNYENARVNNPFKGRKHTPESLAKMSAIHKGNAHHSIPHSEETKARLSEETKRLWREEPRIWITNGPDGRRILESEPIPEGWWRGRKSGVADKISATKLSGAEDDGRREAAD